MTYVGHNGIRAAVMGDAARAPTPAELQDMRERVRIGMDEGAAGLSTGLMYLPGRHATTDEVAQLAEVAAHRAASTTRMIGIRRTTCWVRSPSASRSGDAPDSKHTSRT